MDGSAETEPGRAAPAADSAGIASTLTREEFESMTLELSSTLFSVALRMTRNRADADDLVQEALFRAYRGIASFRKGTNFRAWLLRIVHNAFINRSRREGRAPVAVDMSEFDPAGRGESGPGLLDVRKLPQIADHHFDDCVKAALDDMPAVFREAFVLLSLGGLTYAEIGETVGVPIGTVMSRIHRARNQLRSALRDFATQQGYAAEGV